MHASSQPRQVVRATVRVDHGSFLFYDPTAPDDLRLRLAENPPRLLLCAPAGLALRSAGPSWGLAAATVEVHDVEPDLPLEWAEDAAECDIRPEGLELCLQSLMGETAATVWLGRRGTWRVRAARRPAPQAKGAAEEWLFQVWIVSVPPADPDAEAILRAAAQPGHSSYREERDLAEHHLRLLGHRPYRG